MMRRICVFAAALLCVCCCAPVRAAEVGDVREELYLESGADTLLQSLPEEIRTLFRARGITPESAGIAGPDSLFGFLSDLLQAEVRAPLRALFLLFAVAVLFAAVSEYAGEAGRLPLALCAAASAAGVLLPGIAKLLSEAETVLRTAGAFLTAAVPVYAGLITASGSAAAGTTYGALTLTAANAVSALSAAVFMPLIRIFTGLSAVSAAASFDLSSLTSGLYKAAKWALVFAVTLFSGILSVQTLVTAQADAVAGKAAKFLASSAVPIVGGAIGDAVSAIAGSVSLVKSGAGAFGLLASLAVFLPLLGKTAVWMGVSLLGSFAAEVFGEKQLSSFLNGCATALRFLLAVLCSVGAVSVVAAAVVLCVRGAYA